MPVPPQATSHSLPCPFVADKPRHPAAPASDWTALRDPPSRDDTNPRRRILPARFRRLDECVPARTLHTARQPVRRNCPAHLSDRPQPTRMTLHYAEGGIPTCTRQTILTARPHAGAPLADKPVQVPAHPVDMSTLAQLRCPAHATLTCLSLAEPERTEPTNQSCLFPVDLPTRSAMPTCPSQPELPDSPAPFISNAIRHASPTSTLPPDAPRRASALLTPRHGYPRQSPRHTHPPRTRTAYRPARAHRPNSLRHATALPVPGPTDMPTR